MRSVISLIIGITLLGQAAVYADDSDQLNKSENQTGVLGRFLYNEKSDEFVLQSKDRSFLEKYYSSVENYSPAGIFSYLFNNLPLAIHSEGQQYQLELSKSPFLINRPKSAVEGFLTTDERVIIRSSDCLALNRVQKAFATLEQVPLNRSTTEASCESPGMSHSVDITRDIPSFVKNSVGVLRAQANCFNTVALTAGITNDLGYEEGATFLSQVTANCKLHPGLPEFGDIVIIFADKDQPNHAFYFFSADLGFEKPGYDSNNPYHFMKPSEVLDLYMVADKYRYLQIPEPKSNANYAQAYTCAK